MKCVFVRFELKQQLLIFFSDLMRRQTLGLTLEQSKGKKLFEHSEPFSDILSITTHSFLKSNRVYRSMILPTIVIDSSDTLNKIQTRMVINVRWK
jgi:hypothetical protein